MESSAQTVYEQFKPVPDDQLQFLGRVESDFCIGTGVCAHRACGRVWSLEEPGQKLTPAVSQDDVTMSEIEFRS
jgi:hypothetical protein